MSVFSFADLCSIGGEKRDERKIHQVPLQPGGV